VESNRIEYNIVEHLGSGIPCILDAYGKDAFQISRNFMRVVFPYAYAITPIVTLKAHDEAHVFTDTEIKILTACLETPRSTSELLDILGYRTRTGNFKKAINKLYEQLKLLEPTIPDALRSKNQKYRITEKGRTVLKSEGF